MNKPLRMALVLSLVLSVPAAAALGCIVGLQQACLEEADCSKGNLCADGACQPKPCATDAECGATTECEAHACVSGLCKATLAPAGTPAMMQILGDCRRRTCDGQGNLETVLDPTDVPADDGNPCTEEVCSADGGALHQSSMPEHACTNGASEGVCDGQGSCVECVAAADCQAGTQARCDSGQHACISCSNGVADSDELGVDCGGACPLKCVLEGCAADAECVSGHCIGAQCRLANAEACTGNAQCASLHCVTQGSAKTCQACNGSSLCSSGQCVNGACTAP
jgi:hypothetical protein